MSVHERIAPPGTKSAPHVHLSVTEAFYVLDGEVEFQVAGTVFRGSPHSFVLVPPGIRHGWWSVGTAPARTLVLFGPSARFAFFQELDELTRSAAPRPDPRAIMAVSAKYGWT